MTEITNNYAGPLVIGGVEIATGQTVDIPAWDAIKDKGLYPLWLREGVISEGVISDDPVSIIAALYASAKAADSDNKRASHRRSGRNSK